MFVLAIVLKYCVSGGYAKEVLSVMRRLDSKSCNNMQFPLILGRDFSGVVMATGKSVNSLTPGDEVKQLTYNTLAQDYKIIKMMF